MAQTIPASPLYVDIDHNVVPGASPPLPRLPDKARGELVDALTRIARRGYGMGRVKPGADVGGHLDPEWLLLAFPDSGPIVLYCSVFYCFTAHAKSA